MSLFSVPVFLQEETGLFETMFVRVKLETLLSHTTGIKLYSQTATENILKCAQNAVSYVELNIIVFNNFNFVLNIY